MVKSDIEIAHEAKLQPVQAVAEGLGLGNGDLELYGSYKAKVRMEVIERLRDEPDGALVLVTAMTPTSAGEGKSTTTVGLGDAFRHLGKRSIVAIREPSLGPCFGIKGGAAGGGYAQVMPMEDINLHFTGDFHAITSAHNLLSAVLDNHIFQGNGLGLDPRRLAWKRVLDMNDRALRNVIVGLGGPVNSIPRESGFEITAASEIMAILCLSRDVRDLKERIGRIVVGERADGSLVTAAELGVAGALTVLLKDAIKPNLVQTLEGQPAFVHCGPFANIAHGNNSLVADRVALKLGDYVVTESGFGSDMGMEKFFDIVCRVGDLKPNAVVLVATVKALKHHGDEPDGGAEAIERGAANLIRHLGIIREFGLNAVVAVNRFPTDSDEEVELVREIALANGAFAAEANEAVAKGAGAGVNGTGASIDFANRLSGTGLGGTVYRFNVVCADSNNDHQSEVEFEVRFGL